MAKNGYTLFVELLALEQRELELAKRPADDFGTTQIITPIADPCEMDTEEYKSAWDTRKFLLAPTDPE